MSKLSDHQITEDKRIEAIKRGCWATLDEDCADWIVECIEDVDGLTPEDAEKIYDKNKELFDKFWAWAYNRTMYDVHKLADKWMEENIK